MGLRAARHPHQSFSGGREPAQRGQWWKELLVFYEIITVILGNDRRLHHYIITKSSVMDFVWAGVHMEVGLSGTVSHRSIALGRLLMTFQKVVFRNSSKF